MKQATQTKERGIIVHSGMGGFLNPPTHPEHSYSVMFDLKRKRENRSSCSLSAALENDWLCDEVRLEAAKLLKEWKSPDINSPEVKDWISKVLGYFNDCYSKDGKGRNVNSDLEILHNADPFTNDLANRHLGVMMIREYYPKYVPTPEDFKNAYWGKK